MSKTILDFAATRDDAVMITGCLKHETYAKLQSNHHHQPTYQLSVFTGRMPFLSPNQQRQSLHLNY